MQLDRRTIRTCIWLYAVAQILFLINIDTPRTLDFDESHYVPAARQLLDAGTDPNREHPPLGKMLIAAGIGLFGDRPLGWRVMSTVFGSLTLAGMYLWALALLKDHALAVWASLVTLVNHLLYVQARIAMLDTFMVAFLVFALTALTWAWNSDDVSAPADDRWRRRLLACAGCLLGLATAAKWFGVVAWAACLGLVAVVRLADRHSPLAGFPAAAPTFTVRERRWVAITSWDLARCLVIYPLLAYSICFIPRIVGEHQGSWLTVPADFVQMQARMYEAQRTVPGQHPYMSQWYQWPLLNRPMWYAFDRDGDQVRGVLLLGNPLVMWGGVIAIVFCAVDAVRRRSQEAMVILFFYLAFFASWIVIPRRLSLYYYYYPAATTLSLALAHALRDRASRVSYRWARWTFLAAAAAVFVYFLPVLSGLPIGKDEFTKWMWFRSWI